MNIRFAVLVFMILLNAVVAIADDVGITEVRLIEEEKDVYALEAEISPSLESTIRQPVLPGRCEFLGEKERVRVGPLLVVRYRFTTGNTPLQNDDEIFLPWRRSGVVMTAHWMDGSSKRTFFDRELAGIRVPIRQLQRFEISRRIVFENGIADALSYMRRWGWIHAVLIVACAFAGSWKRMAYLILAFTAGHGISLVATDMCFLSIAPSIVIILTGISILMLFRAAARNNAKNMRYWPVLMMLGLLHGLGYAGFSQGQQVKLSTEQFLIARFAFNITSDLSYILFALAVLGCAVIGKQLRINLRFNNFMIYIGGGLAFAAILAVTPDALLSTMAGKPPDKLSLTGTSNIGGSARTASRPVEVTDPIMGFITITAFEIRCEWLMRARDLQPPTETTASGDTVIPVTRQSAFKTGIMQRLVAETRVSVDDQILKPSAIVADFVSVGSYGVTTRSMPVPEPLNNSVIGVTLAYVVNDAPRTMTLHLDPYPVNVSSIPVAVTDPWGSTPKTLTKEVSQLDWKRRMAGFRRPVIRAVMIKPRTLPVVSISLLILAAIFEFLSRKRAQLAWLMYAVIGLCCMAAIVAYPFIRTPAPSGFLSQRVPPEEDLRETLTKLLTNIYRAFDYRAEEAIYDQLAVSATGDQLETIYLENRSSMELENRGGARASVDTVDVLDIRDVRASVDGFAVYTSWIVSGSVSHFGHTHYRKNRYDAVVHITQVQASWKIKGIDVKEKERVL